MSYTETRPDDIKGTIYEEIDKLRARVSEDFGTIHWLQYEVQALVDLSAYAMTIISNVDGGNFKQSHEWVAAFKKFQEQYTQTSFCGLKGEKDDNAVSS